MGGGKERWERREGLQKGRIEEGSVEGRTGKKLRKLIGRQKGAEVEIVGGTPAPIICRFPLPGLTVTRFLSYLECYLQVCPW
jgi:hypothetical protein